MLFSCLQLDNAENDDDVRLLFEIEEAHTLLLETGFSCPLISLKLSQRSDLKAALIEYNCLIKPKASMDQFVEGLGIAHNLLKCYPGLCKSLFVFDQAPLTAGESNDTCILDVHKMSFTDV